MTCKKIVARITYTVLVETLNPAQSINQSVFCELRSAEKDNEIKQADTVMLNYPLNWNYSIDIMKNDLEFYEQLITDRTPAMTWSWFTIGFKWVNEESKMLSYFHKSYQDYIVQPFKVTVQLCVLIVTASFRVCFVH